MNLGERERGQRLALQSGRFEGLARITEDLYELDAAVSHGPDQSSFLFHVRLADSSTTADRLQHDDAIPGVDKPLGSFVELFPGLADLSYGAPYARLAHIHVWVEDPARGVHPDLGRAQIKQPLCGGARDVGLAQELESSAY